MQIHLLDPADDLNLIVAFLYAQAQQMPMLRTFNDSANMAIIAMNRKLGYQPEPGFYFMRAASPWEPQ
jgi:hypothetical protein